MTQHTNPECKRCGLLRSTVLATGHLCASPSTTDIPPHDFSDSIPVEPTKEGWRDRFHALIKKYGFHLGYGRQSHLGALEELFASETQAAKEGGRREFLEEFAHETEKMLDGFRHEPLNCEVCKRIAAKSKGLSLTPKE